MQYTVKMYTVDTTHNGDYEYSVCAELVRNYRPRICFCKKKIVWENSRTTGWSLKTNIVVKDLHQYVP